MQAGGDEPSHQLTVPQSSNEDGQAKVQLPRQGERRTLEHICKIALGLRFPSSTAESETKRPVPGFSAPGCELHEDPTKSS